MHYFFSRRTCKRRGNHKLKTAPERNSGNILATYELSQIRTRYPSPTTEVRPTAPPDQVGNPAVTTANNEHGNNNTPDVHSTQQDGHDEGSRGDGGASGGDNETSLSYDLSNSFNGQREQRNENNVNNEVNMPTPALPAFTNGAEDPADQLQPSTDADHRGPIEAGTFLPVHPEIGNETSSQFNEARLQKINQEACLVIK